MKGGLVPGAKFCRSMGFLGRGEGQCQGWDHCQGLTMPPPHTYTHQWKRNHPWELQRQLEVYKLSYWQGKCGHIFLSFIWKWGWKLILPSVISQERGSGRLQGGSQLTNHGVGRFLPVPLLLILLGYLWPHPVMTLWPMYARSNPGSRPRVDMPGTGPMGPRSVHACTYACLSLCVSVWVCVCVCLCLYLGLCMRLCLYVCVSVFVCLGVSLCACVYRELRIVISILQKPGLTFSSPLLSH